jgi:prevent-host-death family protein
MTIIGLKELRQNVTKIAERAQKGEKFTVVKRSKPVFTIIPPQPASNLDETRTWTKQYVKKHQKAFDELAKK